ncbi:TPA: FkbM family methyltransferase [Candidatus Poribacteria bacterium]|nr:FkbM family methyltransferase [Candidatus Poribacteria bacterium]
MIVKRAAGIFLMNPYLFLEKSLDRLRNFIPLPKGPIKKSINGVFFEFDFSLGPAIARMYRNDYEHQIVRLIKKYLKKGDTFIDVGANIGFISAVAAGCVGQTGQIHSFEPVPSYFSRLKQMADMNKGFNIIVNSYALGEHEGSSNIDVRGNANIGWNTMVQGFMSNKEYSLEVKVIRLDDYIINNKLSKIKMIKIDVEGYEFFVLKGLNKLFDSTSYRPLILCEIAPKAYQILGLEIKDLFLYMEGYSYQPFSVINTNRRISYKELQETTDIIFKPV